MPSSQASHDVFQAIADPTRRQLLKLLSEKEMSVTAISGHFPISRTAVSKHLRLLSETGLVKVRKAGRETRYILNATPLKELQDWLQFFELYWDNKLSALQHLVEGDSDDYT
ncbi:ArsR/SmtB family transcription factor [Mesobacillus harenae]|uniref:ArsR/SmtB family transcription factor n=1 Tax=Mesobacillus harenae TaxID=2213203 RepID=UPI0015801993|nr:metalloregulator ArsR/SmtB family transcription factor [Mesobacillus harenae]